MAVKQYIGARYTVLPDGEYDPLKAYEPLTLVSYGNLIYVSKKKVPAGVIPTDTVYWMWFGNASLGVAALEAWKDGVVDPFIQDATLHFQTLDGQVVTLQAEIDNIDISGLQADVSNLQGEISTINAKDVEQDDRLTALENDTGLTGRKFVFVGDSFGEASNGWVAKLVANFSIPSSDYVNLCRDSIGYTTSPTSFLSLIQTYVGSVTEAQRKTITDIVVIGGILDTKETLDPGLEQAVTTFCNYVDTNFPNAKLWVGYNGTYADPSNTMHVDRGVNKTKAQNTIFNAVAKNKKVAIVSGIMEMLRNRTLVGSDGVHLTDSGYEFLSKKIGCCLNGGNFGCISELNVTSPLAMKMVNSYDSETVSILIDGGGATIYSGAPITIPANGQVMLGINADLPFLPSKNVFAWTFPLPYVQINGSNREVYIRIQYGGAVHLLNYGPELTNVTEIKNYYHTELVFTLDK